MAIEIKELLIKINVSEQSSRKRERDLQNVQLGSAEKQNIIDECVEKILESLENRFER